MLYAGLRHIMEQRKHCETIYTHNILYTIDEMKSSTKMITMRVMTKKVAAVVTTMMTMMCDDDD